MSQSIAAGVFASGGVLQDLEPREPLTPLEARLVECLAASPGAPVSRSDLLERVWGETDSVRFRTVDTTVRRLRKKLEPDPSQPQYVLTAYARGYLLNLEPILRASTAA